MAGVEVVGAIASVGALFGAAWKGFNIVRSIPSIEEDWVRLNDEIKGAEMLIEWAKKQYPLDVPDLPHTQLLIRAFRLLEQTMKELDALSRRVSRERTNAKSEEQEMKPKRTKWLWLKEDVANTHDRLRDAKNELNMALRLADQHNYVNMAQAFQAMSVEFGTLKISLRSHNARVEQLGQYLNANQQRTTVLEQPRIKEIADLPADEEYDHKVAETSSARQENMARDRPLALCPRPCFCRCHRAGMWSWAQCDHEGCRRNVPTRKASWNLHLMQWLSGYVATFTVSVSLRPRVVIAITDVQSEYIEFQSLDRRLALRHFHKSHPLDTFWNGQTMIEVAILRHNVAVLHVLLSHWDTYFCEYGITRRDFFRAQVRLREADCSGEEALGLRKLLSHSEEDAICGPTTLHLAVGSGDKVGVVDALDKQPLSVNVYDLEGNTPMHLASGISAPSSVAIMKVLEGAGADIRQGDGNGKTPLMDAALVGNVAGVQWLLNKDRNGHKLRNYFGQTALHYAMRSRAPASVGVVELLLAAGAQHSARSNAASTPLHFLARSDADYSTCKSKIKILQAAGADLNAKTNFGDTTLQLAARESKVAVIMSLLDAGASTNCRDMYGRSILQNVALYCDDSAIRQLSNHSAFCRAGHDFLTLDVNGYSAWDQLIYSLRIPPNAITPLAPTTIKMKAKHVNLLDTRPLLNSESWYFHVSCNPATIFDSRLPRSLIARLEGTPSGAATLD